MTPGPTGARRGGIVERVNVRTGTSDRPPPPLRGGLLFYAALWLTAGAVVAIAVVVLAGRAAPQRVASVGAPPVREVDLATAARRAGCVVRPLARRVPAAFVPVRAARPGVYRRPVTRAARQEAVRDGLAVVEYRPDLAEATRDRLVGVQRAAPGGTVLAPSAGLRADQLSVTTYGRQLRCPAVNAGAFDALQLFRGRYLGSGPDG